MITIQELKPEDCAEVADLHLKYYRYHFQSAPGKKLLQCYYESVAQQVGSVGFVAKEGDKVAGYICGVWNKRDLNTYLIRKYNLKLAAWGLIHTISNPSAIIKLLTKLQRGNDLIKKQGYELRPIIVDEAYQGRGAAILLVDRLIEDATERGFSSVFLITEKENVKAQRFYSRMQFNFQKYFAFENRDFCLFEMDVQHQAEDITLTESSVPNM